MSECTLKHHWNIQKQQHVETDGRGNEEDGFTGCTPTKESSKGHPAYACCQRTEAREMQQKQSECSTKVRSEQRKEREEREERGGEAIKAQLLHDSLGAR